MVATFTWDGGTNCAVWSDDCHVNNSVGSDAPLLPLIRVGRNITQ